MKQQRFNIGEQVIALKSISLFDNNNGMNLPIVKGKKYNVMDILYCPKCGVQMVNVDITVNLPPDYDHTELQCGCGCTFNGFDTKLYTDSYYFIKQDDIEETIEEAVQVENYELAGLLTSLDK